MKKLLFILMSFSLVACGGEGESESGSEAGESSAAYYITLGEDGDESNNDSDLGFMSDNISQETQFTLKETKLQINGMSGAFGEDPMSIKGQEYEGLIGLHNGDMSPCKVTISNVTETGKDDMKTDYEIQGKINADGKEGSFSVSMFKMNH